MKMNQFLKLTEIEIKPFTLMRKIVTIKSIINKILVSPYRTEIIVLPTGLISEIRYYKNKRIIKIR